MTQTDRQNDRQTFEFLGLLSEPKMSAKKIIEQDQPIALKLQSPA